MYLQIVVAAYSMGWGVVGVIPRACSQYSESDTRAVIVRAILHNKDLRILRFLSKAGTCVSVVPFMVMRFSLSMPKYCLA